MKTLVVFYSRDGHTKKVAQDIAKNLSADVEEIIDLTSRRGIIGWLLGGRDAARGQTTKIKELQKNPADYDLVIVGTPIWSWNVTPAARTFLAENKSKIKTVAFFCTEGGSGGNRAFQSMTTVSGLTPKAVLELKARELETPNYATKINSFTESLVK